MDAEEVVHREFGPRAEGLVVIVRQLAHFVDSFEVDWKSETLVEAGSRLRTALTRVQPDLSQDAIDALLWRFNVTWR
jgi:hypothetical protein